ncbi:MAG: CHAT domain-containing protein [Anaerolineae bacterium]|nr:CHAT domain-containing protein [Anaerolineae bacterium]
MPALNFAVEIAALPGGELPPTYRVKVASPVGEVSVDVASPLTEQEIDAYFQAFNEVRPSSRAAQANAARELGERLFSFLIQSHRDLQSAYIASLERAGTDGLRIRLSVDRAGLLAPLPWETIRDPNRDFLALSRLTPVMRHSSLVTLRRLPALAVTPRILVVLASPEGFPKLDVEAEWQRLQRATTELRENNRLTLERLEQPSLIALQRKLRTADYHVIHFIGHSDFDSQRGRGLLVFENESGNKQPQIVTGEALGREIGEEGTVRLVVMNSCHSTRRPEDDALAGIASGLVARGISAVVAMQFEITDASAQLFAEEFYRALADELPIDLAMSEARRALANNTVGAEWATPVLYMRSEDGILFARAKSESTAPENESAKEERANRKWLVGAAGAAVLIGLLITFILASSLFPLINPTPTVIPASATPSGPPALPDLQIGTIRISPREPAPGQTFRVSVTITNAGNAGTGAFSYGWDASLSDPVLLNSFTDTVEDIPPGASKNITFPYSYGWWGTYTSQVRVDLLSEIPESNEPNNVRPFNITLRNEPFDIDFTLLPNNEFVNPPIPVTDETFALWNFIVGGLTDALPGCEDVRLQLSDAAGDIVLEPVANGECVSIPLSVQILRAPVSGADLELLIDADGTATIRYFADITGETLISEQRDIPVEQGELVAFALSENVPQAVARIDIEVSSGRVRLSRMILYPPT